MLNFTTHTDKTNFVVKMFVVLYEGSFYLNPELYMGHELGKLIKDELIRGNIKTNYLIF